MRSHPRVTTWTRTKKHCSTVSRKLASGKRIISPNDDPGTLVRGDETQRCGQPHGRSQKQCAEWNLVCRDSGRHARNRRIVGRMAELKGMATQDPLKSSQDVESYNNEFRDLQKQLRDITSRPSTESACLPTMQEPKTQSTQAPRHVSRAPTPRTM